MLHFISFYQKYLTILSFGSCRYYPTCSSYAKMHFEQSGFFFAIFKSIIRILKCNPLFRGGFDYPIVKCPKHKLINQEFKQIKIKYWFVPVHSDMCYMVHNKKWEK